MKNILIAIGILLAATACTNQSDIQNQESTQETKVESGGSIELAGKQLRYDYGDAVYEIAFKSEEVLHWKSVEGEEKGREADENYVTHRLNDHSLFISWVEEDGLGVSQVLNLRDNTVNCFLKIDKDTIPLTGTISEIKTN